MKCCKDCVHCRPFKKPTHSVILLVGNCLKNDEVVEFLTPACHKFKKKERTELKQ